MSEPATRATRERVLRAVWPWLLVLAIGFVIVAFASAIFEVPVGRMFLDDARPTSLIVGLSLPVTPPAR